MGKPHLINLESECLVHLDWYNNNILRPGSFKKLISHSPKGWELQDLADSVSGESQLASWFTGGCVLDMYLHGEKSGREFF